MIMSIRIDLIELLGSRYVIDHCIAALNKSRREQAYRLYITDAIKNINEILAKTYGGCYSTVRYADMVTIDKTKTDERTGDEIALDIIKRAGLKAKGGDMDGTV